MKLRYLILATAIFTATQSICSAVTIHWGNAIFSVMVKSNGTPVTASDGFQFQLGVFNTGFIPNASNTSAWMANWHPLDSANFIGLANYFSSTFELLPTPSGTTATSNSPESDGYQVSVGTKVYLMAYNNTAMDQTTELFLGTADSWTLGTINDSQLTKPIDYRLSGITQPIFGGANNVPGGGVKSPPPGPYNFQTATFIPEPSSALMILLGPGLLLSRRRRS